MSAKPEWTGAPWRERLDRLVIRARLALIWEEAWPALAALLMIAGVFLTFSWLGMWLFAPPWLRAAGLAAFIAALAWPVALLVKARWPGRADALDRIDRDTGRPHRPASSLDDTLANLGAESTTAALWALHKRQAEQLSDQLRVGAPTSLLPLQDRFAVRGAIVVALIASAFVAGPEKYARVAAGLDFRAANGSGAFYRIDAWIDPPAYTGRAPILLRTTENDARSEQRHVEAPIGSALIVRASESHAIAIQAEGALEESLREDSRAATGKTADGERRWILKGDSVLTLRRSGAIIGSFALTALPDRSPVVTVSAAPKSNGRGALTLTYKLEDDYGVVSAELEVASASIRGRGPAATPLFDAPKAALGLAPAAGGLGEAETTLDLSDHPWAGARLSGAIAARDESGNAGRSEVIEFVLPQRPFVNPLARALVEQRRALALYPQERARVDSALRGLLAAPELFGTPAGHYLGLYTIQQRLQAARDDEALREVADLLWQMALQLEEGGLSAAERDLQAAQQALREALERNAPEDEIRQRMNELRAALDRFLQEFADRRQRERDAAQDPSAEDQNQRTITSQDLQRMLDDMEKMAQSGNMADAQRMLEQLQNLLQNLQTARRDSGRGQMSREMNRSLNQLDQMMRDQQELRDQTHQQRRQRSQEEGQEQGDRRDALQKRQQALREQLEDLQQRMRRGGLKPEQGLEEAERAMRDAEQQLGRGQPGEGPAVDAQGRALEGLRQGAQSLAQQMQPGAEPGDQAGEGEPSGSGRAARDQANPDPLGRESRERGDQSRSLYNPEGAPAAQRAQRVLEELRRRLGDPGRSPEELDYFERLLRRY